MFYLIITISGVFIGAIVLLALIAVLKKSPSLPVMQDGVYSRSEKILVPAGRANLAWIAFSLIGMFALEFAGMLLTTMLHEWPFMLVGVVFALAGIGLLKIAFRIFMRRNRLVQLELNENELRQKPVKWYSTGRYGNVNALSVYLSDDWDVISYADIMGVTLSKNLFTGNRLYLHRSGKPLMPLLLIFNNEAQMLHIKDRIEQRLQSR